MATKKLVATGMWWRIGDGRAVNIWENKWILNDTGGQPVSKRLAKYTLTMVHELIEHQRNCWKRQVVEQMFQPQETDQIMQIPINLHNSRDQLIWSRERKGIFTVKSAYKLACSIRRETISGAEPSREREERGRM